MLTLGECGRATDLGPSHGHVALRRAKSVRERKVKLKILEK